MAFNLYRPSKYPKKTIILITIIAWAGILGGYFISEYFLLVALLFWMHYTVVLSYLQFKRKSKHSYASFTEILLHPQIRFFLYEFIAFLGTASLFVYNMTSIGTAALTAWWLLSINFYFYYKNKQAPAEI